MPGTETTKPLRIAIRFPSHASAQWRERCLASLAAAGHVEISRLTPATPVEQTDLILDLSARPVDPGQLARAQHLGYWAFIFGTAPERIAPGLQEFVAGSRAAYARLVRLGTPDTGTLLREGAVKTLAHSLKGTRERLLEAILDWPARVLRDYREQPPALELPPVRLRRRSRGSRLLLYARLPLAWLRNVLTRVVQETTREHWAVGIIAQPIEQVCESFDPDRIRWLPAPPDGFLADPFGWPLPDGKLVIMAEALSWSEDMGRIVAFEAQSDGTLTPMQDVFAFTSHASYPHLLEHEGAIYCIPETLAQRRVQLYRADPFPSRWLPDAVLLDDFAGADSTVHFHDGRWYLFTGNHDDQDETKLYIFHSADLRGPWLPHVANPVKCDLRSARPAGPLFIVGDELYRPAQDCSVTYGGAVVVNRIDKLTPREFREKTVKRLRPAPQGPYPDGLHTLSAAGNVTLVDGKRHTRSGAALLRRLGLQRRVPKRKGFERNS